MKNFLVALDLHGTLLDLGWEIQPELIPDLVNAITYLSPIANFYICTGNDFKFVTKHIPKSVLSLITGCILETGCILNNNCLTGENTQKKAYELKKYFQERQYSFVKYFGERKTTITLFTCDEQGGEPPEKYLQTISQDLQNSTFKNDFYITYSNVAFDIIPANYSKWNTLKTIKGNTSHEIICFMDSYNDKEIALYSDYTILPQNTTENLFNYLKQHQKSISPLENFDFSQKQAYLCEDNYTLAVINGLKKILEVL